MPDSRAVRPRRKSIAGLLAPIALWATAPGQDAPAAAPPAASAPEIAVYAAASLREGLETLRPGCEAEAGARLVFNFGGSNELARQIVAANKADLFFSADEGWMDHVAKAGLLDQESRRSPLSNRLAVVGADSSGLTIASAADLAGPAIRRLSIAQPESVPAGKYAKAWLEKAGVWGSVRERVVPALDVRAALAAVESGAAEAGIVYRTDLRAAKKVRLLYEVPASEGPAISYALAVLKDRPEPATARRVAACFQGARARELFSSFGFQVRGDRP